MRPLAIIVASLTVLGACGGVATGASISDAGTDAAADASHDTGSSGWCDGLQECGGICVDESTNSSNCGACGVVCGADDCIQGLCGGPPPSADTNLVVRKVYLGDTDRNGVASPTAWQQYGRNIDGVTTTAASVNLCTLFPGAPTSVQVDGDDGIDNSYGANIVPILITLMGSTYSSNVNAAIEGGTLGTILFDLGALGTSGNAGMLFASEVMADPLATPPLWNGTDVWPIDGFSQTGPNPNVRYPTAILDNWVWTSGDTDAPVGFAPLLFPYASLPVQRPEVAMTVADDLSGATNGTFSATVRTVDVLSAFAVAAGQISPSLCATSAFDAIAEQIQDAADIASDGSSEGACDSISVGFGFDAAAAQAGSVVTTPTPTSSCSP